MNILIATPIVSLKGYILKDFFASLKGIKTHHNVTLCFVISYDHALFEEIKSIEFPFPKRCFYFDADTTCTRESICNAYNIARTWALSSIYHYFCALECDVLMESWHLDELIKVAEEKKAIVSALVPRRGMGYQLYRTMVLWARRVDGNYFSNECRGYEKEKVQEWIKKKAIVKVGATAFSFTIIPIAILSHIDFRWHTTHINHPDVFFFDATLRLSIDVYTHCGVIPKHKERKWDLDKIRW